MAERTAMDAWMRVPLWRRMLHYLWLGVTGAVPTIPATENPNERGEAEGSEG